MKLPSVQPPASTHQVPRPAHDPALDAAIKQLPPALQPGMRAMQAAYNRRDIFTVIEQAKKHPQRIKRFESMLNAASQGIIVEDIIGHSRHASLFKKAFTRLSPYINRDKFNNSKLSNALRNWQDLRLLTGEVNVPKTPIASTTTHQLDSLGQALLPHYNSRLPQDHTIPVQQGRIISKPLLKALKLVAAKPGTGFNTFNQNVGDHAHMVAVGTIRTIQLPNKKTTQVVNVRTKDAETEGTSPYGSELIIDLNNGHFLTRNYQKSKTAVNGDTLTQLMPANEGLTGSPIHFIQSELANQLTGAKNFSAKTASRLFVNGRPVQNFADGLTAKQLKALNQLMASIDPKWGTQNGLGSTWFNRNLNPVLPTA